MYFVVHSAGKAKLSIFLSMYFVHLLLHLKPVTDCSTERCGQPYSRLLLLFLAVGVVEECVCLRKIEPHLLYVAPNSMTRKNRSVENRGSRIKLSHLMSIEFIAAKD